MNSKVIEDLSAVRVFVSDFKRAIDFYRDVLGFPVAANDEDQWALFQLGNADLLVEAIHPGDKELGALVGRFSGVSFRTKNIQQAYQHLSNRGVSFEGRPTKQSWGGFLAHFRDPDGNVLTLVEPKKSKRLRQSESDFSE